MAKKEKKMRRYKLLEGVAPHYMPNPEFDNTEPEGPDNLRDFEINPGEIVKSHEPLDVKFVNKFMCLDKHDRSDLQSPGGDALDPDMDPDVDRPVRSVEDALVRRADRHLDSDELEDQEEELKTAAKGKLPKGVKEAEESEDEESSEEDGDEEAGEEENEDVTDQFEGASDGGLQVFKDANGKYRIHEEGEDEPMTGAKKGFTKKSEVKKFIKDNVKVKE